MYKNIGICDRCKKESVVDSKQQRDYLPKEYTLVTIRLESSSAYASRNIDYLLCKDCLLALDLVESEGLHGHFEIKTPATIQDRLLDIVRVLVQESLGRD